MSAIEVQTPEEFIRERERLELLLINSWLTFPSLRKKWTPDPSEFGTEERAALADACRWVAREHPGRDRELDLLIPVAMSAQGTLKKWPHAHTKIPVACHNQPERGLEQWRALRCLIATRRSLVETLLRLDAATDPAALRAAILEASALTSTSGQARTWSDAERLKLAVDHLSAPRGAGSFTGVPELDAATGGVRAGHVWVLGAPTNWGKCLGPDVLVLRADGTTARAEEVSVGDELMGPDSRPRRVLGTTAGRAPMFRVVPMRGESWTCNADHILVVADSALGGAVTEISVARFLLKPPSWRKTQKLFHLGVEYPPIDVGAVDPWLLGVWYGDGTKGLVTFSITTPDQEVVDGLLEQAKLWELHLREDRKEGNLAATYSLACTRQEAASHAGNRLLRATRCIVGEGSSLPRAYTHGSRRVRLEFLAGWIDSDGYRRGDRYCEIITQHEEWAKQLRLLCRSLGLQAHIYLKTGVPGYEDRRYWRLHISGDLSVVPTRVRRKQFPQRASCKNPNRVGFEIEPAGVGPFAGWQLDGDGLFLLGDLTVTHNSSWLLGVSERYLEVHDSGVLLVTCEDEPLLLALRTLCRRAGIRGSAARDSRPSSAELTAAVAALSDASKRGAAPVLLDGRGRAVEDLAEDIKRCAKLHGTRLVLVDYLQCISTRRDTQDRRAEINHVARTLTDAIKTSGCAGILASQLTGEDIRESRDVEHAAEVVLIGRKSEEGELSLFLKKNKTGATGHVLALQWDSITGSFASQQSNAEEFDGYFTDA